MPAMLKHGQAAAMSKKALTEAEICDQYITPAIHQAGWDKHAQVRREFTFTAGEVRVRGCHRPGYQPHPGPGERTTLGIGSMDHTQSG